MNREDRPIGSGDASGGSQAQGQSEIAGISKQTAETLMAGERIAEALDLADAEREAYANFETMKKGIPEEEQAKLQPPPRNAILAAYDVQPEAWVLRVVEGVQSTALQDALLVLPFKKVVSLIVYLDIWARRVSLVRSA